MFRGNRDRLGAEADGLGLAGFQKWLFMRKCHDTPMGDLTADYRDRARRGFKDDFSPSGSIGSVLLSNDVALKTARRAVELWRRTPAAWEFEPEAYVRTKGVAGR